MRAYKIYRVSTVVSIVLAIVSILIGSATLFSLMLGCAIMSHLSAWQARHIVHMQRVERMIKLLLKAD